MSFRTRWTKTSRIALAVFCTSLIAATGASAQGGGLAPPADPDAPAPTGPPTVPGARAKINKKGKAIAPADAPDNVKAAIRAGNKISRRPYVYGGGHQSFKSKGYDCSGAVSFVLHAAGLISSPTPSGGLMKWGLQGKGQWITVYANGGHTYAVIAGLRWDTSSFGDRKSQGEGPRWRHTNRPQRGFKVRHADGY